MKLRLNAQLNLLLLSVLVGKVTVPIEHFGSLSKLHQLASVHNCDFVIGSDVRQTVHDRQNGAVFEVRSNDTLNRGFGLGIETDTRNVSMVSLGA